MKNQLEFQADRIEAVLAVHKLPARVTGGTVTPRWIRFQALPAVGAKISKIKGLHEELAAALDASNCRVSRRGAAVAIEIPRGDPQPVEFQAFHQQLMLDSIDGHYTGEDKNKVRVPMPVTALLGLAEDGAPLLVRLPSRDVGHVLVAGNEGAGKTTLLYSMILSLALTNKPSDLAFCLLGYDLEPVSHTLNCMGFQASRTATDLWSALPSLIKSGQRIVIFADDVGARGISIQRLAQAMRTERLHFVLAWDGIPPEKITDLFKVRIVGHVNTVSAARQASGWRGTGAERLAGQGDFLVMAEGKVCRFQSACIEAEQIHDVAMSEGDKQ